MARPLTYAMAEAIRNRRPMALLAAIEHPDGTGYFWTGIGRITWEGNTYAGIGTLGGVSPLRQNSELSIQQIVFALSGIDQTVLAKLNDDVRNRIGQVWLACLNERGQIVRDPKRIMYAQLDFQAFNISEDGAATIAITGRSGFYTLEGAIDEVWSPEQQAVDYPGDTGMDLVWTLQNKDLQWTPS